MSAVKYDTDIESNVTQRIKDAQGALDDVKVIYKSIDDKLDNTSGGNSGKWEGLTHDKCVELHEVVKEYEKTIRPVCDQLEKLLSELDTNVTSFT